MKNEELIPIWRKIMPYMLCMLEMYPAFSSIQLKEDDFKAFFNEVYSGFSFELRNGEIINSTGNSMLAIDFLNVLLDNPSCRQFVTSKHVFIQLDINFTLQFSQKDIFNKNV